MRKGTLFLAGGLAAAILYKYVLRPRHLRWGAEVDEVGRYLPDDDLTPFPRWGWTHAVNIDAPPEKVWPWLIQIGYGRAGWYTFDWLYEMMGAADFVDGKSAERIIPELQHVQPGEKIQIMPKGPYTVARVEPNRLLLLHESADLATGQPLDRSEPLPERYINSSWLYALEPLEGNRTRLLTRFRFDADPSLANMLLYGVFIDLGSLVMQRKMLAGIKERAERL